MVKSSKGGNDKISIATQNIPREFSYVSKASKLLVIYGDEKF